MVDAVLLERVTSLTADEQVEFIGAVWDSLDHRRVRTPMIDEQMLDNALDELQTSPASGIPAADSVARLRQLAA